MEKLVKISTNVSSNGTNGCKSSSDTRPSHVSHPAGSAGSQDSEPPKNSLRFEPLHSNQSVRYTPNVYHSNKEYNCDNVPHQQQIQTENNILYSDAILFDIYER